MLILQTLINIGNHTNLVLFQ